MQYMQSNTTAVLFGLLPTGIASSRFSGAAVVSIGEIGLAGTGVSSCMGVLDASNSVLRVSFLPCAQNIMKRCTLLPDTQSLKLTQSLKVCACLQRQLIAAEGSPAGIACAVNLPLMPAGGSLAPGKHVQVTVSAVFTKVQVGCDLIAQRKGCIALHARWCSHKS